MIKRFISTLSKQPINITEPAWTKIKDIINANNSKAMLFSAKGGGCNGFNYNLETINEEIKNSSLLENDNYKVFVDPITEMYLLNTTIDYIKEDYNKGIFESKFVYIPDKDLATSCGCGVSFSPKNF